MFCRYRMDFYGFWLSKYNFLATLQPNVSEITAETEAGFIVQLE